MGGMHGRRARVIVMISAMVSAVVSAVVSAMMSAVVSAVLPDMVRFLKLGVRASR